MSSSSQGPSPQLQHLQVLRQHTCPDLQRHVLYRMCDHRQLAQQFLHHSSPYVQKFHEYRALIPKYLARHSDLLDLHKSNPSAPLQVAHPIRDHLYNARRQAIVLPCPSKSHLVPKHLRVRHRNQKS